MVYLTTFINKSLGTTLSETRVLGKTAFLQRVIKAPLYAFLLNNIMLNA